MGNAKLVLLRHGQSVWNKKNLFTGWVDVPLSPEGIEEAIRAGQSIDGIDFSVVFTSTLIRAKMTAAIAMSNREKPIVFQSDDKRMAHQNKEVVPAIMSWHLNERMYGDLQGMNKDEARAQFGKEQVHIWRRSFDVPPPNGESLEMTAERTLPYFKESVEPYLAKGENVLISAHGNSLRSIVYMIERMSKDEILNCEIPTGQPLHYTYVNGQYEKS